MAHRGPLAERVEAGEARHLACKRKRALFTCPALREPFDAQAIEQGIGRAEVRVLFEPIAELLAGFLRAARLALASDPVR